MANSGAKTIAMLVEAAVMKPTAAATVVPPRVRGRQSTAQNSASSRCQGASTVLSAISMGAIDSKITAAARRTRSVTDRMCPTLA